MMEKKFADSFYDKNVELAPLSRMEEGMHGICIIWVINTKEIVIFSHRGCDIFITEPFT